MTHSHLIKNFFIVLVLGLVLGFLLDRWLCGQGKTATTTTKVDTTIYYKPIALKPKLNQPNIELPKLLFAPADTVVKTIVQTANGDSVEVSFPTEQRVYKDSTYYAIVSGAVVGDRRPTLDYIETYNKTITTEVTITPKKVRPYVGASICVFGNWSAGVNAGVLFKDHHAVGAGYERAHNDNRIKLNYSYLF